MRAHTRVSEALKDGIGARAYLLSGLGVGKLIAEHRQQHPEALLVGGAITADRVKANGDQLADMSLDAIADGADVLDRPVGRVVASWETMLRIVLHRQMQVLLI